MSVESTEVPLLGHIQVCWEREREVGFIVPQLLITHNWYTSPQLQFPSWRFSNPKWEKLRVITWSGLTSRPCSWNRWPPEVHSSPTYLMIPHPVLYICSWSWSQCLRSGLEASLYPRLTSLPSTDPPSKIKVPTQTLLTLPLFHL